MSVYAPLPLHLWLCSADLNCPSRAALSRFLAALDQPAVEALRALFQKDLVCAAHSQSKERPQEGSGIDVEKGGMSSMQMARDRQLDKRALPANARLPTSPSPK